jgi:hypothetical protein
MKPIVISTAALLGYSLAAWAQVPGTGTDNPGRADRPVLGRQAPRSFSPVPEVGRRPEEKATAATRDSKVSRTIELPPEPIPIEQLGNPNLPLPDAPIDAYLLRKEHGPFMVLAHTFRGPEATRYALALVLELRNEHKLPAYIWHVKIHPGGSNIRNVQPTASPAVPNAEISAPEKYRIFDEAAVLVGHAATVDDGEKLLRQVKKIRPKSVDALPSIWGHRKGQGLYRAMLTQNPLQAAQNLYPGQNPKFAGAGAPPQNGQAVDPYVAVASIERQHKSDPLVVRMNSEGPHSIYRCPGPYTLPVCEFRGRSTANTLNPDFQRESFLKKSPLARAADDAEYLASCLEKCRRLKPQFRPYVFHDRFRSVVTLGSFSGPDDPKLAELRNDLSGITEELLWRKFTQMPLGYSTQLMEVPRP